MDFVESLRAQLEEKKSDTVRLQTAWNTAYREGIEKGEAWAKSRPSIEVLQKAEEWWNKYGEEPTLTFNTSADVILISVMSQEEYLKLASVYGILSMELIEQSAFAFGIMRGLVNAYNEAKPHLREYLESGE